MKKIDGMRVGLMKSRNRRGAGEGQIPAALLRSSAVVFLLACGARSEVHGTGILDASTEDADFFECFDSGACNANETYCRFVKDDAGVTTACVPLPTKCHSCACAAIPEPGFVCVCTSDGDQIIISCNAI